MNSEKSRRMRREGWSTTNHDAYIMAVMLGAALVAGRH